MKYFMVVGKYAKDPKTVENFRELIPGHMAFIKGGIESGLFLFAGPSPGKGGAMVAKAESVEELCACLAQDPLNKEGILEYEPIEFKYEVSQECVKEWFN